MIQPSFKSISLGSNVKDLAKRLLYYSGYYPTKRRIRGPRGKRLLILMYHESATRAVFAAHLSEIRRRYRLVSLRQAISEIQAEGALRQDSVAITFDDGYPSVYTIAYPLLRQYGAPATVFVLTGWINQEMVYWWQHLRDMIKRAMFDRLNGLRLNEVVGFQLPPIRGEVRSDPGFRGAFADGLERVLIDMPDGERARILERLQALLMPGVAYSPQPTPALTWDQIRRMAEDGIEFEAHTRTHVNLRYTQDAVAEREIMESKKEVEERLQRAVTGFAYPYGKDIESYHPAEAILAKNGFAYAVHAVSGSNSNRSNLSSLRRGSLAHSGSRAIAGRDLDILISTR